MTLLLRIVFTFILVGIASILIFSSFFSTPNYLTLEDFSVSNIEKELSFSGGEIFENNLSDFDTLFSVHEQEEIEVTQEEINIPVTGLQVFLSSFRDLRKKYTFSGKYYHIEQEGIGEIFIDTKTSPGKVFIFTINTSAHIYLTDEDNTTTYTDIYLTPRMYLEFRPSRGKALKNADVVRVETINKMGYLGEEINNIYKDNFLKKYSEGEDSFLSVIIGELEENDILKQKKIVKIAEQEVGKIPGYDFIERYMSLFMNQEKKKVFYKNLILESYIKIIQADVYTPGYIYQLQQDLDTLKEIDVTSFNEMKAIEEMLVVLLNSSIKKEYISAKISFLEISSKKKQKEDISFYLYAYALYNTTKTSIDLELLEYFLTTFEDFVSLDEVTANHSLRFQYFAYSLKHQLFFSLQQPPTQNLVVSIINILTAYIPSSELSYTKGVTSKITSLYVYDKILEEISIFLRENYFLVDRTEDQVLEIDIENQLTPQQIIGFKSQIESIILVYEKYKGLLDTTNERDNSIKEGISGRKEVLKEYFEALENYASYVSHYDISKKDLLGVDIFSEETDTSLSNEKIITYLNKFTGISFDRIEIEIVDDWYYSIKNVVIAGKNFNFDIYPYQGYALQDISIDGKELAFGYKLEKKEEEWNEKFKTASREEKDKYDFKRFFLVTFLNDTENTQEDFVIKDIKGSEDKTEIVFKRDKLTGDKGEFKIIQDTIRIEYSNVDVQKNNTSYDIFITDALVLSQIKESKQEKLYKGILKSEYVLNSKDHYFKNIGFKVYNTGKDITKGFKFEGKEITVVGKIHLTDIIVLLEDIFKKSDNYNRIYNSIHTRYPGVETTLQYTTYNKKISFIFDYSGKKYTILYGEDTIDKIVRGGINILENPIDIEKLGTYLK